jgi:hypothetical protein
MPMPSSLSTTWIALLVSGLVGCEGRPPSASSTPAAVSAPAGGRVPAAASASQLDLARELDAAGDAPDPDAAMDALAARWRGKHLTWTVTRQPALCKSADACHVIPFPVPAPDGASRHGWLPTLAFAPGEYDVLVDECGDAGPCQITFTGELTALTVSSEEPTALGFTGVRIVTRS